MAKNKTKVLLVEDDLPNARVYREYLRDEPYDLTHVEKGQDALTSVRSEQPDAIILDLGLPDMSGLEVLKTIRAEGCTSPIIVITANGSINTAVEAMRGGAADFLLKPFNADRLVFTLRHALERNQLAQIVETFRQDYDREDYCGFVGASVAMQEIYQTIDRAAPSKATVFIQGDSGTGKEVCAEALHLKSPRKGKPFIVLNCGAIPKDLMESEIFGHVRGSFTGAVTDRQGAASMANGGTLFLDEICEMDLALQVKLLRFIQTGSFHKVGSSVLEKVDVRFICATNRNPWEEIKSGNFREDLFYRLHVIPIELPQLAQRDNDVMEIAERFLREFSDEEHKSFSGFDPQVVLAFIDYHWPGNVRELQNVIRNVVVLREGPIVEFAMLPAPFNHEYFVAASRSNGSALPDRVEDHASNGSTFQNGAYTAAQKTTIRPLWQVERDMIQEALDVSGGNIQHAAALLELSPSTLYRRLRSLKEEHAA